MRNIVLGTLGAIALAFVACGPDATGSDAEAVATTQQGLIVVPPTPVDLATWNWSNALFSGTPASAYLIATRDPYDAQSFYAWGFDVARGRTLFFFRGSISAHLEQLATEFARETTRPNTGPGSSISTGMAINIRRPQPPPPPGGVPLSRLSFMASDAATNLHQVTTGPSFP